MNIQKLRDMNLHTVADELERLREFKANVESQKPVYFWKEIGETDWMECHKDWYLKCVDSPEHDTKLLYAKPAPDDKPAVAVPDGWKLVPFDPTQEMQKAGDCAVQEDNVWSETIWHAMLAAAPSHSQQSDGETA